MEVHYHNPSLHDSFYPAPSSYPLHSDQYLAAAGDVEFAANFSLGSSVSYPYSHEGSYVVNRGEGSLYRAEGIATGGLGATGLGFSDNNTSTLANSLFPAEEMTVYSGQPWGWNQQAQASTLDGVVAPVPVLPSAPEASFLPLKSKQSSYEHSPDPPLPTPAAMAVLLSSGTRADNRGPFDMYDGVVAAPIRDSVLGPPSVGVPANHGLETASREKKHAVANCISLADLIVRALRLVFPNSTSLFTQAKKASLDFASKGIKARQELTIPPSAFVCDICGRRFGVNSNLNRHVKRCALKPVNMAMSSPPKSCSPSSGEETSGLTSPHAHSPENSFTRSPTISHKRGSISSISSSSSSSRGRTSMSPLQNQHSVPTNAGTKSTQKRRRRAPSPSRWVPLSLLSFNLVSEDMYRSVSVPLAPVRRNLPKEERDSWDENVAPTPYHPKVWKGVLPGPGLPSHQGLRGKELSKSNVRRSIRWLALGFFHDSESCCTPALLGQ